MCPSLTLQQIYKLTEHHHDDWITGNQTTDTLVLLQTLKRVVDANVRPTSFAVANCHSLWMTLHECVSHAQLYLFWRQQTPCLASLYFNI